MIREKTEDVENVPITGFLPVPGVSLAASDPAEVTGKCQPLQGVVLA